MQRKCEDEDMEYQQGPRAEALVSRLEPLLSAPRKQIEKYMKLRSKRSVDKLTDIMQEYNNTAEGKCKKASDSEEAGDEVASDAASLLSRARKQFLWRSTYSTNYSGPSNRSKSAGVSKQNVGSGAFDKIWRSGEKPQLERWKETTSDDKIKQLADTCRGIYSLEEQEGGNVSEYRRRFGRAEQYCTPRVTRDRNRSEVPIGSIYSTDPWELEASAVREKAAADALKRVQVVQDVMMNYKKHPKKQMQLTFGTSTKQYKMKKYSLGEEIEGCLKPQTRAMTGTGRSEYRSRYIAHT